MLREDVVSAVEEGSFHVYSASSVDEALALLTGFSSESIDARVLTRIKELQELARSFAEQNRQTREDKWDE